MSSKPADFALSHEFFSETSATASSPVQALGSTQVAASASPGAGSGLFESDDRGLVAYAVLHGKVDPDRQALLDATKQQLADLCGICSAYVGRYAESRRDENFVYDVGLWANVIGHLPLMSGGSPQARHYSGSYAGVEIAGKFLETIMEGAAVEWGAPDAFSSFLQSLGERIRAGLMMGLKNYRVCVLAITLAPTGNGNEFDLGPMLKGYFVEFKEEHRNWLGGCANYNLYDVSFSYSSVAGAFEYKELQDAGLKAAFDVFLQKTPADNIRNSRNFFEGLV
jgi:hypothetical protein